MTHPILAARISITQLDAAVTVVAGYPEANTSYRLAYQAFLRYFADLDSITRYELLIGAHFIYGWMPRILTLHGDLTQMDHAAHILTETKHGQPLTDDELNQLASLVNNSIVGASKLLHFVWFKWYAMWDSRVCTFLYGPNIFYSRIDEVRRYRAYLDTCYRLAGDPAFPALHTKISSMIGIGEIPPTAGN